MKSQGVVLSDAGLYTRFFEALSLEGSPVEEWSNAVFGSIGAIVGAFGLWMANRMLGKAAFQTAINSGFKDLTDQLQEERRGLMAELSAERMANSTERSKMRGEISNLRQVIESLKNVLRDNGICVPESAYHPSGAEGVHVLPGTPGYPETDKERT